VISIGCFRVDAIDSWDDVYREERANYSEFGDVGEIWFVPKDVSRRAQMYLFFPSPIQVWGRQCREDGRVGRETCAFRQPSVHS
jgi:hypothetical protein